MIKYLDNLNNEVDDAGQASTAVYQEELESVFTNWTNTSHLKNIVPNTKFLHEDKSQYLKPDDNTSFNLVFNKQKVTEVSSMIRDKLNQLDLSEQFGDLANYIVLIGTELVQNALIADESSTQDITLTLYQSETSFKVICNDNLGTLTREQVMSKLQRAFKEKTYEEKKEGAGLGLYMVINSCDRIIFDLQNQSKTTICCIINKYKRLKEFKQRKAVAIHFLEDN